MSNKESKSKPKQRLKGVENFLRRMAFNLGNSPSQTEVKIISCIPIDVTDLQKKIISLEKQLDDAKKSPVNATVATAHQDYRPDLSADRNFTSCCNYYDINEPDQLSELHKRYELCCERAERSRVHCVYPTISVENKKLFTDEPNKNIKVYLNENKDGVLNKIKKKKDLKKHDNVKTQLVYYAQTANTPFNNYDTDIKPGTRDISNKNYNGHNNRPYVEQMIWGKYEHQPILEEFTDESDFSLRANGNRNCNERDDSRLYFEQMMRRQYEPRPILNEFSNGSTFSSPICRDTEQNHNDLPLEFDSCSCCYGAVQNIDNPDRSTDNLSTHAFKENISERSTFYDSSLYDMVPVKEISTKVRKNGGHSNRKQKKTGLNITYPQGAKALSKNHSLIINYHTLASTNFKSPKISPIKVSNKMEINKIMPRRYIATTSVEPVDEDTSKSCCIDFGNVYMKQMHKKLKPAKMVQTKKPLELFKDTECMAINVLNTECQTVATQSMEIDECKTEQTLDQIKSILQTVLTEVKTNAQQKTSLRDKDTKDAVVQKGMSRGNMPGCSDLLRSYTYSACNMNLYSRQLNPGQYCSNLPYNPMKCMHNFPVFIQTPNRNMCSSCYRNTSSHFTKAAYPRPAITAATNTDNNKEHNKETEKLIKEIYKSITVNFDVPTKDTSMSGNDDLLSDQKSISKPSHDKYIQDANKSSHCTEMSLKVIPNTSTVRNTSMITSFTPISTDTFASKQESNTVSVQSQAASTTDTEHRLRNDRIQKFVQNKKSRQSMRSVGEEHEQSNDNSVMSESTEASDEETEQGTVDQQPIKHNKEKKNIFTKMLKSVKLFKNKHKQEEPEHISETEEEEDDSDYQTIYSHEINRERHLPTQNRSRKLPHSKISYSRQMRDRYPEKRMPYKDQEYRRQWTERPVYRDHQHKYVSEQPYSRDTSKRIERQSYWQNYETRNIMIDQNEPTGRINELYSGAPYINSGSTSKYVNVPRKPTAKGLTWLKKHKLGTHCGEQWKKLILEG